MNAYFNLFVHLFQIEKGLEQMVTEGPAKVLEKGELVDKQADQCSF